MSGHDHDVAIYLPAAALHYRSVGSDGGGAELQTVLLARQLVAGGLRVAHIVWPVDDPGPRDDLTPDLVERAPHRSGEGLRGRLYELRSLWRGLRSANASTYIFRTGRSHLIPGAAFCRAHRRHLIFSGANDLDFTFDRTLTGAKESRLHRALSRWALGSSGTIVTQTSRQLELARQALPGHRRVMMIPSFVEPAAPTTAEPDAFVWVGRLADYKRPLEYMELARACPDLRFRMIYFAEQVTPAEVQAEIERRAAMLPNLDLLGRLPRPRVLDLIGGAFAVVSTSSFEGMPNVFLEAWARAVPVLTLECDPGDRIAARRAGLLAGGSRERLAEQARRLAAEPALRAELGANGRAYVNEVHDPERVGERWKQVLDSAGTR
jgi:glycosyltransferase involved in cell wall biosynthesis